MDSDRPPTLRLLTVLRVPVGAGLMLAPERTLSRLAGGRPSSVALRLARVLGARGLVQAALVWRSGGVRARRVGAALDAAHAVSTIGLCAAARRRPDCRLALLSGASAAGFAVLELLGT